jgi:hypothetical protein
MKRILLLLTALALLAATLSCGKDKPTYDAHGDTPTEAYKRLFAAVKAGDTDAIKAEMTKKTIEFNHFGAQRFGKSDDEQIRFGMTSTTETDNLPQIRDERVKDNMGALEVWNAKENRWDDLPFMMEDGKWKLAYGDGYAGTWHSPGRGRSEIEAEAANALRRPATPAANVNMSSTPKR